jgi:tRNA G18 (ribose-2'-O)-methylase SpoU
VRGYFAIGIEHTKTPANIGSLFRTAHIFGAAFCYTVGRRYQRQASDTTAAYRHIPMLHFDTLEDLHGHLPFGCMLVGVELDDRAVMLDRFEHPERACYLLGAEDHGLTRQALSACHHLVRIPGRTSLNVSVAGSIVVYDRITKAGWQEASA